MFAIKIEPYVSAELQAARLAFGQGDAKAAFSHLERAHVLGQASTVQHVRVHCSMLVWAVRQHNVKEVFGQLLRIVGAGSKTAIGLVPSGNTGGANVSPFKRLPVPADLAAIIANATSKQS